MGEAGDPIGALNLKPKHASSPNSMVCVASSDLKHGRSGGKHSTSVVLPVHESEKHPPPSSDELNKFFRVNDRT